MIGAAGDGHRRRGRRVRRPGRRGAIMGSAVRGVPGTAHSRVWKCAAAWSGHETGALDPLIQVPQARLRIVRSWRRCPTATPFRNPAAGMLR